MVSPDPPEGKRVGSSPYIVGQFLYGGSFGRIHRCKDDKTGKEVAVKLEAMASKQPQLPLEYNFYKLLGNHPSIPTIYAFDAVGNRELNSGWHAMVMDMLGPSLKELHDRCGNKFTLQTTVQVAVQMIALFEHFHSKQLVYRDMKPDNFLVGLPKTDTYNVIHVIDLGLCKQYIDEDGAHIKMAKGKMWTGTVRYMSINNHLNCEQSRRDDMEALGYMLVYLFKGQLPWQGVNIENLADRYREIGFIKRKTKYSELCSQMPTEFAKYMIMVRNLDFEEEPNYKVYSDMFRGLLVAMEVDIQKGIYDWDKEHKPRPDRRYADPFGQ